MERVGKANPTFYPDFIGSWIIKPYSLCDELIDYFEEKKEKQRQGETFTGLDTETKDSMDISIKPKEILLPGNEIFKEYFDELFLCHRDYIEQWPFINTISHQFEIGSFNLQRYLPGQHFKKIHTERTGIGSLHRVFAFMTYLNDVQEGGSTYFTHYGLEIKPRKGLTLLWPAEWTHAHKGNILKKGSKYIITGWLNFAN
tara:strand:- start:990 stop:1589 length:600 start_codon:yes stop_codon:yes gene_type:complete